MILFSDICDRRNIPSSQFPVHPAYRLFETEVKKKSSVILLPFTSARSPLNNYMDRKRGKFP